MDDVLKTLLDSKGIEETLVDLMRGKFSHKYNLERELTKHIRKLQRIDIKAHSRRYWEEYIRYQLIKIEIEGVDKELNSLCYSFVRALSDKSNTKQAKLCFKESWDDLLERMKQVDIVQVVSRYMTVNNPKRLLRCPFHEDKSASLKLYIDTNSWYCFGCCKGGASVNFVMQIEQIPFKEAMKKILNF